jgi:heptosyltransferase II
MDKKVIFFVPNWLGDSIMAMPTLQLYRKLFPEVELHLVVKPRVEALWKMHECCEHMHVLKPGFKNTQLLSEDFVKHQFDTAYVMPNSFRAAYIAWRTKIPKRIGRPGHWRKKLLTHSAPAPFEIVKAHQAYDYLDLVLTFNPEATRRLGKNEIPEIEAPRLNIPPVNFNDKRFEFVNTNAPLFSFLPGAARGPSKQWPPEFYARLGKLIANELGGRVIVLGTPDERSLCEKIAKKIGANAFSYAGISKFHELPALLTRSKAIICNDSGGMHLASALSVPLIAIFGITDPSKTGPLSPYAKVLQKSSIRSKAVPRRSKVAEAALASITPNEVYEEILKIMSTASKKEQKNTAR